MTKKEQRVKCDVCGGKGQLVIVKKQQISSLT
jgi:hypothetical protein